MCVTDVVEMKQDQNKTKHNLKPKESDENRNWLNINGSQMIKVGLRVHLRSTNKLSLSNGFQQVIS